MSSKVEEAGGNARPLYALAFTRRSRDQVAGRAAASWLAATAALRHHRWMSSRRARYSLRSTVLYQRTVGQAGVGHAVYCQCTQASLARL